ncbi:MAG: hypothetical protein K2G93_08800 [Rikenella sp.]|nr:hypothetical protein [Rikenella sp.]
MKPLLFSIFTLFLLSPTVAAGQESHEGRTFLKRIENNYANNVIVELPNGKTDGMYNLNGKSAIEKLLFGQFNAPVECYYDPSGEVSPNGPQGVRIYRDSTERWVMEVKRIPNFREVNAASEREFPIRSIRWNEKLSDSETVEIRQRNREMAARQNEQRLDRYRVESQTVPLSDTLAARLYDRTVRTIDTYVSPGKPLMICDGYSVVFRTVVGNDLWTFRIDNPTEEPERLSDLFRAMIADVEAGRFDEAKYLDMLR